MSREKELTTGGSEVRRYDVPTGDPHVAEGSAEVHAALRAHFDALLGPPAAVLEDTGGTHVRIDVHFVAPSATRPTWTLYTLGMSDRPMRSPSPGAPALAELVVSLPAGWKVDKASLADEAWYWPVRALRLLASFPHVYDTCLGVGDTVGNGDPPVPFAAGCPFSALLVRVPAGISAEAARVVTPAGEVRLYAMVPLTAAEIELKLEKGTDALLAALDAAGVGDVVDIGRPGAAAPRKRWYQVF